MFARLEDWLRETLGFEPNASHANQRGMRLFGEGQTAEAVAEFERAVAAAPYFAAAWLNLAGCRRTLGDHAAAARDYTQAIECDPQQLLAWNGRGLAHLACRGFARPMPTSSGPCRSPPPIWT